MVTCTLTCGKVTCILDPSHTAIVVHWSLILWARITRLTDTTLREYTQYTWRFIRLAAQLYPADIKVMQNITINFWQLFPTSRPYFYLTNVTDHATRYKLCTKRQTYFVIHKVAFIQKCTDTIVQKFRMQPIVAFFPAKSETFTLQNVR